MVFYKLFYVRSTYEFNDFSFEARSADIMMRGRRSIRVDSHAAKMSRLDWFLPAKETLDVLPFLFSLAFVTSLFSQPENTNVIMLILFKSIIN